MNEIVRTTDEDYNLNVRKLYLDAAASSDPEAEVMVDMMYSINHYWHNPSSVYESGKEVRRQVEHAREQVKIFLHADNEDTIIFGSNASEMIGLALNDVDDEYYVMCSTIDHPAVYNSVDFMVVVNDYGVIYTDYLKALLEMNISIDKAPIFITGYVNSEIGTIQPLKEISDMIHKYNGIFIVDACQAAGHIPIDVQEIGADMLIMTSEKVGSIRGTGVLYVNHNSNITLYPLYQGGGQENGLRGGTENTYSIIALGNQLERLQNSFNERQVRELEIRKGLVEAIDNACEDLCEWDILPYQNRNTYASKDCVPNILSVHFWGIDNQQLLTMLDMCGVECSAGSACSSHKREPSRVLKSIGLSDQDAMEVLRFSFDYRLKDEEIMEFGRRLRKCLTILGKENNEDE